ncbi:uncharacterized protein LOC136759802 [Amia ocellicauda]|uniref:uncharacterized protein LOC136759802 n=1 Tax=Amia ocellicauda TaxID=2972642 RepID=UPI0034649D36
MSLEEEWLSSRLRLCELSIDLGTGTDPEQTQGDILLNTGSASRPAFNTPAVLNTLRECTHILREAQRRDSVEQQMETDAPSMGVTVQAPTETNIPSYANSLAIDIMRSVQSQWKPREKGIPLSGRAPEVSHGPPGHAGTRHGDIDRHRHPAELNLEDAMERLAQGLTSIVIQEALQEMDTARSECHVFPRQVSIIDEQKRNALQSIVKEFASKMSKDLNMECMHDLHQQIMCLISGSLPERKGFALDVEAGNTGTGTEKSSDCSQPQLSYRFSGLVGEVENETFSRPCPCLSRYHRPGSSGSLTTNNCCSILTQTGLPSKGSIDYPDAPPPTPLVPDIGKSRDSFTRKLKGGLAKEFLPSPPPPTPKDHPTHSPQEAQEHNESKAEFVAKLIRSLSLECFRISPDREEETGGQVVEDNPSRSPGKSFEENQGLSDYASQLASKIFNCSLIDSNKVTVTDSTSAGLSPKQAPLQTECPPKRHYSDGTTQGIKGEVPSLQLQINDTNIDKVAPIGNGSHPLSEATLHNIADKWAKDIIEDSLEVMTRVSRKTEEADKNGIHSDHDKTVSQPFNANFGKEGIHNPATERDLPGTIPAAKAPLCDTNFDPQVSQKADLNSFTRQLITDILLPVVQELKDHTAANPKNPIEEIAEGLSKGIVAHSILSVAENKTSQSGRSPTKLNSNTPEPKVRNGSHTEELAKVIVEHSLEEALKACVAHQGEASYSELNKALPKTGLQPHALRPGARVVSQLDTQNDISTQQLEGVLHWAAVSQMQISALHVKTPTEQLQSQLSSVARIAVTNTWTVGDLLTSLLNYCHARQQAEARGRSLHISLLEWVQDNLQTPAVID